MIRILVSGDVIDLAAELADSRGKEGGGMCDDVMVTFRVDFM
jgi:hypothetical protein